MICDRCHIEFDEGEHTFNADHLDVGYSTVCRGCYDYFNSDEYMNDLKDKELESRYEQKAGK